MPSNDDIPAASITGVVKRFGEQIEVRRTGLAEAFVRITRGAA
jgi:hypothetical protein